MSYYSHFLVATRIPQLCTCQSQMGPHLQYELKSDIVSSGMFGLVTGEDDLSANTILLRLADGFRRGNTEIRLSFVRVFLIERKHHDNRKHKQCNWLLSMARVANHLELLKQVKPFFNGGYSESKASSGSAWLLG
ncbi:uncharacterized protein [Cicer arietinum]|uniref:uncharacterized protein n=1 Tax=Cicer arietinum TaxID=3827 RepID=UPI003CC553BF